MGEHPIRLIVSDDLDRRRLTTFLRLLLAIPHYIWLALWTIVALLAGSVNWFATLALGRSPGALHRFLAAYVKYVTQLYAYLGLAAEPYPPFDGQDGYPIDLAIAPPLAQRRWKVAFRLILALPAIAVAGVLAGSSSLTANESSGVEAFFAGGLLRAAAFLGWFAILARGRMPRGLRDAAAYGLSYGAQLWAYLFLLTERYPDSDPLAAVSEAPTRSDPIRLAGDDGLRRSRLTVLFRLPLAFPHFVWLALWSVLALLAGVVNWLATLILGRPPAPLHRFLSAYLRYLVSVYAFVYLAANPFPGFAGSPGAYPLDTVIAPPERQGRWKVAFRLVLVLPALLLVGVYSTLVFIAAVLGWFAALVTARMPQGLRNASTLGLRYYAQALGYLLVLTDAYPYSGPCHGPVLARSPGPGDGAPGLDAQAPPAAPGGPSVWPIPSPAAD
jgi:Domain of unknown function (DUF4389)